MNEGLITRRYAKALLEFATKNGEDKALYVRMGLLSHNSTAIPRFREALLNPVLSAADKVGLIFEAAGGGNVEQSFERFVGMVLGNRRERFLHDMALSYMALYRKANHIIIVSLVSAMPMSDSVLERIKQQVEEHTHGTVELATRTDESIKGGFVFQIGDMRLDASVAGQLEKVRRQFIQKNRAII